MRIELHASRELALRVERAEMALCARGAATARGSAADVLEVGGGWALYGAAGSPFNKVLGLGLDAEVGDPAVERLEQFYRERRCPVSVELCPMAQPGLAARLTRRGYLLQAFENVLARRLPAPAVAAGDARVTVATADQTGLWVQVVAEGFVAGDSAAEGAAPDPAPMSAIMRGFDDPAITRYLGWLGDEPAGGGAAHVHGGVLLIAGTATRLRCRRRGVQRAIAARAMADAGVLADTAVAVTDPGSSSQRTFERLGFQVLYTRSILSKAP